MSMSKPITIETHFDFLNEIVSTIDFPGAVKDKLTTDLSTAVEKCRDPKFYYVVTGEFSSGKSTLINALLQDNFLSVGILPTTAIVTHVRKGAEVDVELRLENSPRRFRYSSIFDRLSLKFRHKFSNISLVKTDVQTFIDELTTGIPVTEQVVELLIYHPSSFLDHDIVLIDTPGINADRADFASHIELTKKVVGTADAALITVWAGQVGSLSLRDYLDESLASVLNHSIFVITQMDEIPLDDRQAWFDNAKNKVAYTLGIDHKYVFESAAQIVTDTDVASTEEERYWLSSFERLKQTIQRYFKHEKLLTPVRRGVRHVNGLYQKMEEELRDLDINLAARLRELEGRPDHDFSSFIQDQREFGIEEIKLAQSARNYEYLLRKETYNLVDRYRSQSYQQFEAQINQISNRFRFAQIARLSIRNVLTKNDAGLLEEFQSILTGMSQICRDMATKMDDEFKRTFRQIDDPLPGVAHFSAEAVLPTLTIDYKAIDKTIAEVESKLAEEEKRLDEKTDLADFFTDFGDVGWLLLLCFGGGAAAMVAMPPLGLILLVAGLGILLFVVGVRIFQIVLVVFVAFFRGIGRIASGFLRAFALKPYPEAFIKTCQDTYKRMLSKDIANRYRPISRTLEKSLHEHINSLVPAYEEHIKRYEKHYGLLLEMIQQREQREQEQLREQLQFIAVYLEKIEQQRELLQQHANSIAKL